MFKELRVPFHEQILTMSLGAPLLHKLSKLGIETFRKGVRMDRSNEFLSDFILTDIFHDGIIARQLFRALNGLHQIICGCKRQITKKR